MADSSSHISQIHTHTRTCTEKLFDGTQIKVDDSGWHGQINVYVIYLFGLNYVLSDETGIYIPSESEYGCASFSGTPLVAGEYVITVSIQANVTVVGVGLSIDQLVTFDIPMTVNPGQGGNASFTYSPNSGCSEVLADFEALITAEDYDVSYYWDFGNGFESNQQFPPSQIYNSGIYYMAIGIHMLVSGRPF